MLSMTGYGKSSLSNEYIKIEIEIKTVNNRYLDIYIRSDDSLRFLDSSIREKIQDRLSRGRVDVYINVRSEKGRRALKINKTAFKDIMSQLTDLLGFENIEAEYTQYIKNGLLSPDRILLIPGVIDNTPVEEDQDLLKELTMGALDLAVDACIGMRKAEGLRLKDNIKEKLKTLMDLQKDLEKKKDLIVADEKKRLEDRVKSLLPDGISLNENILENELVIFAQKSAIDEELVRLKSHFTEFEKNLDATGPVGKTMDFIVQEMNREVNTIASKSNDQEIRSITIKAKTVIEEIRQQIQNVE